jgi:hypothetical protein
MKRNSIILSNALKNLAVSIYPEIKDSKVEIRIDEQNAEEILFFLLAKKNDKYLHIKKFARILREVVLGNYPEALYGKEPPKGKNVTAMKFSKKQENIRIVCKEIFCKNKKVIMVTKFHKKSTKGSNISKKDLPIFEAVGGYEYEC